MVIPELRVNRGEVWWVDFGEPLGSEPGYKRPALVIQSDAFNHSKIGTVVVVALTTNLRMAGLPGNFLLTRRRTGLPKDSVVNVSQVATLDKENLLDRTGRLTSEEMEKISEGLKLVLAL